MKLWTGIRSPQRHNLRLAFRTWVFNTQVKTAPTKRVTNASLFVRGQHNKRNAPGFNRAQLRNTHPPNAQQFQQHGLESLVYLIQLIDQQDAGVIALQGTQERAGAEELLAVQL